MLKSLGKLVYNPQTHLGSNHNWLILSCDDSISKYYRSLYSREYPYLNGTRSTQLTRPVFGAHISIVRGERISNHEAWGFAANKFINFEYEPGVHTNGEYYWLKVKCDELCAIRELFGLPREPRFGLHLTIGRTTEDVRSTGK